MKQEIWYSYKDDELFEILVIQEARYAGLQETKDLLYLKPFQYRSIQNFGIRVL